MKNSKGIYTAKHIAVISVTVALLIGGQFALSFAAGVEIVTLLLCVFSVAYGIRDGVVAAVAFSLLRCLVFGFAPTVIVLYMIYYPIFAFSVALYGKYLNKVFQSESTFVPPDGEQENDSVTPIKRAKNGKKVFSVCLLVVICVAFTAGFTMLDNVITPLMLGFGENSTRAYFFSSLPTLATHCTCVFVSISVLFFPVYRVMISLKRKMFGA